MRGPLVPRPPRVSPPTAHIALADTFVDAAGARPGRALDGVSPLEVARRPGAFSGRALLLANNPVDQLERLQFTAVRKGAYKYAEYGNGERELYHLASDPFEETSLHAS